jgi:toxin ParE1/3/4
VPEIRISHPAKQDLSRIWLRIAEYSERSAEALSHEIQRRLKRLEEYPEIGAPRENLLGGCRLLTIRRYVVLYRFDPSLDEVHILRILEGERDLTDLF